MTRTGKIARLPQDVREELNRRLYNGEKGRKLIAWLNQHPEVILVLAEEFGGREIKEWNLSEWKTGGYPDWVAERELVEKARELANNAGELAELTNGSMANDLAQVLTIRYADLLTKWNGEVTVEFQRKMRALEPLCKNILALGRRETTKLGVTWGK